MNRSLVCFLVVTATLSGCKGKPTHREAPADPTAGSAGPNAGSGSAAGSAAAFEFPHGDGTPPKQTKGPLAEATRTKLRALTFPGFTAKVLETRPDVVTVEFHTDGRPKLKATIQIQPCDSKCLPMELAKWHHLEQLKEFVPDQLKTLSDTTFEVGETELNGAPMIDTYQVGMAQTSAGTVYSDTYVLYYNDGSNQIRVVGMYADNKPESREQMVKLTPKEDLEHLTKAFVDVYTQAWAE